MAAPRRIMGAAMLLLVAVVGLMAAARTFAVAPGLSRGGSRAGGFLQPAGAPGAAGAAGATPADACAALLCAGGVAALAALGAAGARRGRAQGAAGSSPVPRTRGGLVVAGDGSSWGTTGYDASTSLDTSGKLPFVTLKRGNDEATVYLFGGCVTSYKTDGTDWLAVRPDAKLDGSKPISGGLPHCFPQFGQGDIQQHGFARNLNWKLLEEPSEAGKCVLELRDTEETRAMWPHAFRCEFRVELQEGQLATTLKVENTSASDLSFTTALHSYYSVMNVSSCKITGPFDGVTKIDKTEKPPKFTSGTSNVVEIKKPTEEIYKEVLPGTVVISDPSKGDLSIVSGGGWRDVVIWNPYGDKAMGADGFVCVESAELASVPLPPKGVWEATMNLVPRKKA